MQVAAVLRGRKAELQVTDQQIGDAIGVSQEQVSRFLKPSRVMTIEQTEAICDYLGLDLSAVLRGERQVTVEQPPPGADVRTLITWLLNHPEQDVSLINRLDDSVGQTGLKGRRLAELQETIRDVRREELMNALDALPPSTAQGGDHESG